MSNFTGTVQAGLQIALDTVLFRPKRGLYNITKSGGGTLQDIIAQATITENHHDELHITEHPVQLGAMIADHAYRRPSEVTLQLGWSNSPSLPAGAVNRLITAAVGSAASTSALARTAASGYELVRGVQGIQSAMSSANVDQINDMYDRLLELQSSRALFDLYTGKRRYSNMICKTLTTSTDAKSAYSLPITMVCQEIILVSTSVVKLPASTQKKPSLTASTVPKGAQSATETSVVPNGVVVK